MAERKFPACDTPGERVRKKPLAGHLRHIAGCLDRMRCYRFAAVLRSAARELAEVRWENGVLRRKLKMQPRKPCRM